MAPTMDTGAPDSGAIDTGSSGGDLFSAVGDALDTADQVESSGDVPGGEEPTTPPAPAPGGPATPPGETASPYQLTEDGASYVVPKADFQSLNGLKSYAESVQQYFPTAGEAQTAYQTSSDYRALFHDFLNGDDNDLDAVLGTFAGNDATNPQAKAQFQESFSRMMQRAPQMLQRVNPQAYEGLADNIQQGNIEAAYQAAATSGNPEDLLCAQRLDWGWNGKFRADARPANLNVNPQAQQLQQREQALVAREKAIQDNSWKGFDRATVNGPRWQNFDAEIDKTLEPVKAKYDDLEFAAIRNHIRGEVIKKLDSDPDWAGNQIREWKTIETQFRRYGDGPALKQRIQTYNTDFMARTRRFIPSIAKPLLDKAGQRKVAQAQATARPAPAQAARPGAPQGQRPAQKPPISRGDAVAQAVADAFRV